MTIHKMTTRLAICAAALALSACAEKPPQRERLLVTIEGMHCEGCAEGIMAALAGMKGVLAADVHFSNAVQAVDYDANRLQPARIVTAIADRGFTVQPASGGADGRRRQ